MASEVMSDELRVASIRLRRYSQSVLAGLELSRIQNVDLMSGLGSLRCERLMIATRGLDSDQSGSLQPSQPLRYSYVCVQDDLLRCRFVTGNDGLSASYVNTEYLVGAGMYFA